MGVGGASFSFHHPTPFAWTLHPGCCCCVLPNFLRSHRFPLCEALMCFLDLWASWASKDPRMCPKPTWPCTQVWAGVAVYWPCPLQVRVRERGEKRSREKWWAHPFCWTKEGEGVSEPLEIKSTGLHSSPPNSHPTSQVNNVFQERTEVSP